MAKDGGAGGCDALACDAVVAPRVSGSAAPRSRGSEPATARGSCAPSRRGPGAWEAVHAAPCRRAAMQPAWTMSRSESESASSWKWASVGRYAVHASLGCSPSQCEQRQRVRPCSQRASGACARRACTQDYVRLDVPCDASARFACSCFPHRRVDCAARCLKRRARTAARLSVASTNTMLEAPCGRMAAAGLHGRSSSGSASSQSLQLGPCEAAHATDKVLAGSRSTCGVRTAGVSGDDRDDIRSFPGSPPTAAAPARAPAPRARRHHVVDRLERQVWLRSRHRRRARSCRACTAGPARSAFSSISVCSHSSDIGQPLAPSSVCRNASGPSSVSRCCDVHGIRASLRIPRSHRRGHDQRAAGAPPGCRAGISMPLTV